MNSKKSILLIFAAVLFSTQIIAQFPFTGKPQYQILTKRGGTFLGTFTVELFPNIAAKHSRNFDSLVGIHFYDTTAFHRCVPGFVIQGGDPNSRHGPISTWGYGQPGQTTVPAEFSTAKHVRGILSAARSSNINSATSQFFICVATAANLNGQYSVYGRVTKGINYVDTIVLTPKLLPPPSSYSTAPAQKIEMFITYIGSNDTIPVPPTLNAPPHQTVGLDSALALQLKWNAVSDGIVYEINVSRDSLFIADTILSAKSSNLSIYVNNLKGNTRYYWRARTNNGGHFSPYSSVWNFHTAGETTGITTLSNTNKQMIVYPNPGSGKFTFENLEKGSQLELFDPSGKQIIVSTCKDSSMVLNLEKKEKGLYTYRITNVNGKLRSGKLIVQ